MTVAQLSLEQALVKVEQAFSNQQLSIGALQNIHKWLAEPEYEAFRESLLGHIAQEKWATLDDVFWTVIPFGTGGRRGKMYPIGCNAINSRTIGESARGLAEYVLELNPTKETLSCAIAYDTRHRSREFAELCAEIMLAAGFKVYFLDEHRSTPQLSFMVRQLQCDCGMMVTASHNPPSDNAVKVYWNTGGQILPPHDQGVIDRVMSVTEIPREDFQQGVENGDIDIRTASVDRAFIKTITRQTFSGPRNLSILYSPLHGVGSTAVVPALKADGYTSVEVYPHHAEPHGDFPNIPGNIANPENAQVFDSIIEYAKTSGAQVALASDPDCDRLGCAAPLTLEKESRWATFSGNQIGALLTDYVLSRRQLRSTLSPEQYVLKTLVTTDLIHRIATSYGVSCHGNLLVGFKWIGGEMDRHGPEHFLLGAEESHGYLVGDYARDKDGAVAALLLCGLAAHCFASGMTLHQKLEQLYLKHGLHGERLLTLQMPGSEGMAKMSALMAMLREDPPETFGGLQVVRIKDYLEQLIRERDFQVSRLEGPRGNMVILELEQEGNYIAARPSGTEPKVKFYIFTRAEVTQANLQQRRSELNVRLDQMEQEIHRFASDF